MPNTLLELIEGAQNSITSELRHTHEKMGVTTHMLQKGFTTTYPYWCLHIHNKFYLVWVNIQSLLWM